MKKTNNFLNNQNYILGKSEKKKILSFFKTQKITQFILSYLGINGIFIFVFIGIGFLVLSYLYSNYGFFIFTIILVFFLYSCFFLLMNFFKKTNLTKISDYFYLSKDKYKTLYSLFNGLFIIFIIPILIMYFFGVFECCSEIGDVLGGIIGGFLGIGLFIAFLRSIFGLLEEFGIIKKGIGYRYFDKYATLLGENIGKSLGYILTLDFFKIVLSPIVFIILIPIVLFLYIGNYIFLKTKNYDIIKFAIDTNFTLKNFEEIGKNNFKNDFYEITIK